MDNPETIVKAGARFKFPTGHEIDVHELWDDQWLYQVWLPGDKDQYWLARMDKEKFEQEVVARGGKRVR